MCSGVAAAAVAVSRVRVAATAAAAAGGPVDCGAGPREPELPEITESEALRNILSAEPLQVFLAPGDICSVCLEPFSDAAVAAPGGPETIQVLRRCTPPIVALRCGHALHLECAEAAVAAAGRGGGPGRGRHVRCPLCREPATLAGTASARLFS